MYVSLYASSFVNVSVYLSVSLYASSFVDVSVYLSVSLHAMEWHRPSVFFSTQKKHPDRFCVQLGQFVAL
uniref:Uncharacterized protein n=1 Tax=Anguilla anguilla TaxID=7936 RepID=A0A0E9TZX8_ANGAN